MTTQRYWAVVPAAGVGKRMGADRPKQYLPLAGQTVIEHTLAQLIAVGGWQGIVVAISAEDPYWPELPGAQHPLIQRAPGGNERADSVLNALEHIHAQADDNDWVLVHDAARPCVSVEEVQRLISTLQDDAVGGILALPVSDTLKRVERGAIQATVDRSAIWRALTPQMFRYGLLRDALRSAAVEGAVVTDESSAIERLGHCPRIVEGRPENLKITRPEDLALAAFYLAQSREE